MLVPIAASASGLGIGAGHDLFGGRFAELGAAAWTVAPDGKRLLVAVPLESESAPTLTLVSGWITGFTFIITNARTKVWTGRVLRIGSTGLPTTWKKR